MVTGCRLAGYWQETGRKLKETVVLILSQYYPIPIEG